MKGRKPKLAVVQGDALPDRCPGPPSWMADAAKREWRRVAPLLHERRLLAADTMATLEAYCIAVGVVRESYEVPATSELSVFGAAPPQRSPAIMKVMFAAIREARLLAAELGLTPHRRGIKGKEEAPKDGGWDADLLA